MLGIIAATLTGVPIGRSAGVLMPGRNPDALRGELSNLNTTHVYEPTSSKPSGTTAWIVYVTTMPLPSRSNLLKFVPSTFFTKEYSLQHQVADHLTHFWAKIFFLLEPRSTFPMYSYESIISPLSFPIHFLEYMNCAQRQWPQSCE